jgi:DNA-binding transcriptional regulator LsrR (DeoR family)
VVIKAAEGLAMQELRQTVAHFAAPWVASMIRPGCTLALAGGRVMQWLARSLQPPSGVQGLTVVQAMGSIDATVGPYDALELGRVVARRWAGEFFALHTPALLPNARTCKTLLAMEPIRLVMERLRCAQIALVGVGTLENSVFVERGALKEADIVRLKKAGAVGEICGRFLDRSGRECATPYRDRVVSVALEDLKRSPDVIAVVAGSDRTDAIRGALEGGLIKSLVIDEAGAIALLGNTGAACKNRHE